jgi:hypothetical protein
VPLAARRDELKCGVGVVDLAAGSVCAMLEFQMAVEEIFDVQLLNGVRFPEVMGFQKDTIRHTFIVPPEERSPRLGDAGRPEASASLRIGRRRDHVPDVFGLPSSDKSRGAPLSRAGADSHTC